MQQLPKRPTLEKSNGAAAVFNPSMFHYQQALASMQLQQPTFIPTGEPLLLFTLSAPYTLCSVVSYSTAQLQGVRLKYYLAQFFPCLPSLSLWAHAFSVSLGSLLCTCVMLFGPHNTDTELCHWSSAALHYLLVRSCCNASVHYIKPPLNILHTVYPMVSRWVWCICNTNGLTVLFIWSLLEKKNHHFSISRFPVLSTWQVSGPIY